jgi:hydrogenase maturation protease
MGDESVGIHVVRHLENNYDLPDIDIIDGGTGGFHLLEYFQNYQRVILVDATIDGKPPGTIGMLKPKFSKDYPPTLTAHDIGLKDLLDSLYLMNYQPLIVLFTISIGDLNEVKLELSPKAKSAIPKAAEKIVEYLQSHS